MRLRAVRRGDYGNPDRAWAPEGFAGTEAPRRAIRARIEHGRAGAGAAEESREMHRSFGDPAHTPGLDHEARAVPCIDTRRKAGPGTMALAPRGQG